MTRIRSAVRRAPYQERRKRFHPTVALRATIAIEMRTMAHGDVRTSATAVTFASRSSPMKRSHECVECPMVRTSTGLFEDIALPVHTVDHDRAFAGLAGPSSRQTRTHMQIAGIGQVLVYRLWPFGPV